MSKDKEIIDEVKWGHFLKDTNVDRIFREAFQQAVLTGLCLIKHEEDGSITIPNPVKGCECGE